MVSSKSSYVDRPKVDGISLLPLSIVFMLSNFFDLRFAAHLFYLDFICSQVIDISYLLLDYSI